MITLLLGRVFGCGIVWSGYRAVVTVPSGMMMVVWSMAVWSGGLVIIPLGFGRLFPLILFGDVVVVVGDPAG